MRKTNVVSADDRATRPGASSGQSMVELALMLPVLAIVLVGILDLGRIYYAYITVVNVARAGARYAAAHPPKPSCDPDLDAAGLAAIELRARKEAETSGINPAQLTIRVSCGSSDFEMPIMVTVWYNFQMITTRIVGLGPIRLRSDTTMQIFSQ